MRKILTINKSALPEPLSTIPSPPSQLFVQGMSLDDICQRPRVAIVGSRKITPYGRAVTSQFAGELAKRGVVIVSGLALGVDAIAHTAALEAGGTTVAVLPSGLDAVYPSTNRQLAKKILEQGGALVSEYPSGTKSFKQHFIARNRLVSGLSDTLLVTEAAESSGTMHTARFARQQDRTIFAIPGNITNHTSSGTNQLIQRGATIALRPEDILEYLNVSHASSDWVIPTSTNPHEQIIIEAIASGIHDGAELLIASKLPVHIFNQSLTMLEITGVIRNDGNNHWNF